MYSRFRLKSDTLKNYLDQFEKLYPITPVDIDKERSGVYKKLHSFTGKDGVIDGKSLQEYTFPNDAGADFYHVFISYSHNDTDLARRLCAYLKDYCGLRVFLDCYVWKSADGLLKQIDDKYCKTSDKKHYVYGRRNFSTSHIHAMLSMAILDIINRTECCIFLDSEHSIHIENLNNTNKARTLSPWIYEEISFMRYLPLQQSYLRERKFSSGARDLFEGVEMKMSHEIDFNGFIPMEGYDLQLLAEHWGTDGLDALYHRYGYKPSSGGINLTDYQ